METANQYNVAVYCRLRKDDNTDFESTSIGTQKMMLEKYCHERGYSIYDIYIEACDIIEPTRKTA